jgi:hypothetical protein
MLSGREGYVMPDGSRVDPANDHKYQADSSEPRETRGRDRLLTAVYLADVSTVDGLLEEEESVCWRSPYFISLSLLKEVSSLIFVLCILLISCFLVRRIRAFLDQLLRCKSIASK